MSISKLTVLESASSIILTKRHTPNGTENYGDAKWYSFEQIAVSTISEFAKLVDSIAQTPTKALILDEFVGVEAAIKATHNDERVYNPKSHKVRRVTEAFKDSPQHIVCFDIDGWVGTDALQDDPTGWVNDPESAILEWVGNYLPAEFQDVDFYWQVSSSAGLKPGLRAHVWFWSSDAVTKAQLSAWVGGNIKPESTADTSLYARVRIHYTATPIFEDLDDPVPVRSGVYDSMISDVVALNIQQTVGADLTERELDDDDDGFLESMASQPPLGLTEDEARDAIHALDGAWFEEREKWLEVGMALHHEFGGNEVGFRLWDDWSQQSDKYVAKDMKTVWKSFRRTRSTAVKTMASVMKLIKATGVAFEQLRQKLELITNYRSALEEVAKYDLDGFEVETVVAIIQKKAKAEGFNAPGVVVKKAIKEARSEYLRKSENHKASILEDWLASEAVRKSFGKQQHLLRFAKMFWFFDDGYWRVLDDEVVSHKVYKLVTETVNDPNAEHLRASLLESGRVDSLNALTNSVKGVLEKRSANDMSDDPMKVREFPAESIMNCGNGELVFRKKAIEFRDHDPDNRLTCRITADYEPEAESPEWDKALLRIFEGYPDRDEVIRHLHEVLGYIIQTTRNMAAWVMLYGSGSNGKTFILQVLQALMGPSGTINCSLGDFSGPTKSNHVEANVVGKMLLVDDDFKKGAMLPDDILKKLSEAKMMTANPKFGAQFNFVSRVTPVVLTNHLPKTSDNSYGLTRRALVFHFKNTITEEEKDTELPDRIRRKELSGVLNHLIAGWERLQKRGRFDVPLSCEKAKALWLANRNVVAVFAAEVLEVTGNPQDVVEGHAVWDAFKQWGMDENAGSKWGRNNFYSELEATPGVYKVLTRHDTVAFKGVRMRPPPDPMWEDDDELI